MASGRTFDVGAAIRYGATFGLSAVVLSVASVLARSPRSRVDLLAPIIVFLSLELELLPGLVMAFGLGYLADVFSGEPRGLYWSSTVLLFLVLRLFVAQIVGSRPPMVVAIVLLTTALGLVLRLVLQAVIGFGRAPLAAITPSLVALVVGALFLGYPIYRLFSAVDDRLKPREDQFFRSK